MKHTDTIFVWGLILVCGCTTTGGYTGGTSEAEPAQARVELVDVSFVGDWFYVTGGLGGAPATAWQFGGGVSRIFGRWIFESIGFAPAALAATNAAPATLSFPSGTNAPTVKL